MNPENFPIVVTIISIAVVAVIALLINIKFKLPKKIFFILAMMMTLLIVWYSMGGALPQSVKKAFPQQHLDDRDKTVYIVRGARGEPFRIEGETTVPFNEKGENVLSMQIHITAPENLSDSAQKFSFSLIQKNGEELKNLAVATGNTGKPAIVGIFNFGSGVNLADFSTLKITADGVPAYDAKIVLLQIISKKEL